MASSTPHVFARHPQLPFIEMRTAQGSDACYWTHTHDEYSVGIIDAGSATYGHGEHQSAIRAGMTVLVSPELPHSCNPTAGQVWSYRMMYLQTPWVLRSLGLPEPSQGGHAPAFKLPVLDSPGAYRRLDLVCKGIALVSNPLAIEESLLTLLGTYIQPHGPQARRASPLSPALQRARDCIASRLEENVTLEDLARECEMDAFQLIRKFKAAFGQTPHAFQIDQRINLSKRLLKHGHSLSEVAYRLGFSDQAHFQRHFKKRHAISPKAYLRD